MHSLYILQLASCENCDNASIMCYYADRCKSREIVRPKYFTHLFIFPKSTFSDICQPTCLILDDDVATLFFNLQLYSY